MERFFRSLAKSVSLTSSALNCIAVCHFSPTLKFCACVPMQLVVSQSFCLSFFQAFFLLSSSFFSRSSSPKFSPSFPRFSSVSFFYLSPFFPFLLFSLFSPLFLTLALSLLCVLSSSYFSPTSFSFFLFLFRPIIHFNYSLIHPSYPSRSHLDSDLVHRFRDLSVSRDEFLLLKAVVLFNCLPKLTDAAKVADLRDVMFGHLSEYLKAGNTAASATKRIGSLMLILPQLRQVAKSRHVRTIRPLYK